MRELCDNCTSEWTTRNGVDGRMFTSNINGASLFLPAAGTRWGGELYYSVSNGCYWSRMLASNSNGNALNLSFDSEDVYWYMGDSFSRDFGQSVRAVRMSQTNHYDVNGDGSVTVNDIVKITQYVLGTSHEIDTAAADVNVDGSVTVTDIVYVTYYILYGVFPSQAQAKAFAAEWDMEE